MIEKKIDSFRRVKIPTCFFKEQNFSERQPLEISIQFGEICIEKFQKETVQTKPFTGIVRNLDSVHRIVIPSEYLDILDLKPGTNVNLEVTGNLIKIKK